MSARDDLLQWANEGLKEWGHDRSDDIQAEDLVNAFAHELAERQRAWANSEPRRTNTEYGVAMLMAHLIDPQASTGPVRPDEEPTP